MNSDSGGTCSCSKVAIEAFMAFEMSDFTRID